MDALIKPKLRSEYEHEKFDGFPRDYNAEVSAYNKRTPCLFKTEFEGDGIIGLCSKMYFSFNDLKSKYCCKGVNKRTNAIDKDTYLRVLLSKASGSATNRGFRVSGNSVYLYSSKKGFYLFLW